DGDRLPGGNPIAFGLGGGDRGDFLRDQLAATARDPHQRSTGKFDGGSIRSEQDQGLQRLVRDDAADNDGVRDDGGAEGQQLHFRGANSARIADGRGAGELAHHGSQRNAGGFGAGGADVHKIAWFSRAGGPSGHCRSGNPIANAGPHRVAIHVARGRQGFVLPDYGADADV